MINSKVCSVVMALAGVAACGGPPEDPSPDAGVADDLAPELRIAVEASLDHLDAHAVRLGLGGRADLRLARAFEDELGLTHARFQQTVGGVPVFGGEGIVHLGRDRSISAVTDAFIPRIAVDPTPKLTPGEAISRALPRGTSAAALATPPATDLWALRHDGRDRLVWRVQLRLDEGTNRISLPVVFVDAHDGELVWQYDNLQTGTGPSLYSGTLTFETTPNAGIYYMEDLPRKLGTFDMKNSSTLYRFDDADDVWDAAAQRAGIDAHHGALKTYEYFKNVHGRDGIDGNGGPGSQLAIDGVTRLITSRVHYGSSYNNAFWDGTRMTYGDGDGSYFSPLVTLDVAGHEMMHGITQHTAGLVYSYESGALNESYSDVFGAMVERYARGESDAIWKIGDECYTPGTPGDALRHMDAPHEASNKGYTTDDDPDHYSERYTGYSDNGGVHINSGIPNKTFYLLAMGGTHHLGGSMTGIGADKAAAIWYKALTTYMTSSTNFVRAGRATYDAAVALHGEASPEAAAVVQAWGLTGIVVDLEPPVTAITAPADGATVVAPMTITASATDNAGVASVQFLIDGAVVGTDTTSPYSYNWNTLASGNGTHTIASKAFDAIGYSAQSATITVTVDHEAVPPAVAITAPADGATVANTVTVTADATDNVAIARVELLVDGALYTSDTTAPYGFNWSSTTLPNGPHALTARAFDTAGNSATSAPITVTVDNDHTPPEVAITAPAEGATVENTVPIDVDATDSVGVTRVDFYVGGTLIGSDTTAPYSFAWNTHAYADGSYALEARARDAIGNVGTSATVTVAVDNDSIPPAVAITAPASGSTVMGTVTVTADATDNVAVTRVELLVNGAVAATDTAAPWEIAWNTLGAGNGAHSLVARAYDALNNSATSSAVSVTAANPGIATYDPSFQVPRCAAEGSVCDTGGMVDGRNGKGPEPNAPNTLGGTCIDGTSGTYHGSESLDRLRVFTTDGHPIAAGKTITIEATVWATSSYYDTLDLYHTATPGSPVWTHLGSFNPSGSGARTISTTFTLPSGTQHVIRGQLRYYYGSASNPCYAYSYNDRDDLMFAAVDVPDTTPPAASITAPAAGAKLRGLATVTAAATDNIGVTAVELHVDGALVATDATAPYSFAWDTLPVPEGAHTLTARAIDLAGNTSTSAPVEIEVDNLDVTAPVATITSPAPGTTVSGTRTVSTTASDDFGVTAVELHVDGALIATDTPSPYNISWSTYAVPNGPHTLQTRARDAAGNVGQSEPVTVTVSNYDGTAPATSITSPAAGATVTGTIEVTATASDFNGVSKVDLYVGSTVVQTATTSPYTFTWDTTTKANGSHTLRTRAYDPSGNSAYSTSIPVTVSNVDTTPPAVAITAPVNGEVLIGTRTISVSATDLHGVSSVEIYVDGTLIATDTTSPYSRSWNTNTVPNGPHVLHARALDSFGNAGQSAPITVTVNNPDVTSPTTSITSPSSGSVVSGTITVTTSSNDNVGVASVELLLDGNVIDTATSAPWSFTWDTTTVANKARTLRTRARDAAGNTGLSTTISITVDNGIGTAEFDPGLQAPMCAIGYDGCDTGTLVNGRGGVGPEPNAPNTIADSCWDGGSGGYHSSTSIDRLRVFTTDGKPLAYGKTVIVEATMWNLYNLLEHDVVDFYYTTSPSSPSWTYIGSVAPGSPQGIRVASTSFSLPYYASQLAVRATTRRKPLLGSSTASPCTAGQYNDHDDLVFTVGGP